MKTKSTHTPGPEQKKFVVLTCERCGRKTEAGHWLGFIYVGVECLRKDDYENL